MTQEEFEEKLAKLVYHFVNNNKDEDLEEATDLEFEFEYMNKKIDIRGTIVFDFVTTRSLKELGYL